MGTTHKKVLVVEDDNDLRVTLTDKLSSLCEAYGAADGAEAVEKFVDNPPDLILLDLLLPKLDGFKVLERLRKYPNKKIAEIPVIVLSNLWSNKDILQARALTVEAYYVKAHTDLNEVVTKIHQVLKLI